MSDRLTAAEQARFVKPKCPKCESGNVEVEWADCTYQVDSERHYTPTLFSCLDCERARETIGLTSEWPESEVLSVMPGGMRSVWPEIGTETKRGDLGGMTGDDLVRMAERELREP